MRTEKSRKERTTIPALLLIISSESFPKTHRLLRVVAPPSHINDPDVVGFRFLLPTVGQLKSDFFSNPIQAHECVLIFGVTGCAHIRAGRFAKALADHGMAHTLGPVM